MPPNFRWLYFFCTIVYGFLHNSANPSLLSSVIVAGIAVVGAGIVARIASLIVVVLRVVTRVGTPRIVARIIARIVTIALAICACGIVVELVSSAFFAHYALALRTVVFRGFEKQNRNDNRRHCYAYDKHYAKRKRRVGDYVAFVGIGFGLACKQSVAFRLRNRMIRNGKLLKRIARGKSAISRTLQRRKFALRPSGDNPRI